MARKIYPFKVDKNRRLNCWRSIERVDQFCYRSCVIHEDYGWLIFELDGS
ncbi:hypothetical protein FOXG_21021 [Fusarium oxysporum f. sp. lycopersici 4287]|uniref:Uncharacterized protein n=1 Tax=Fusarium oxysporum f. sp. lycopersici (strain 4287 / CBS 123668 / FGSC 9935 / NRRL 34936) TaxID=426428 RepID=A0A0J9VTS3_FUSO4|nr:hypothetical protein FOXG_21021 [Fusarium oxysporum f. sp. lycopersici 4287]KNB14035.1 hypothetical protein FOXG_21021 [Fusarium oxysporum f. sp. lycopersici 4287]